MKFVYDEGKYLNTDIDNLMIIKKNIDFCVDS